jgi:hypothetical protein
MGFALQGFLLVRERCPFRGPYPPDVIEACCNVPEGTRADTRPPSGSYARDEFVLSPGGRNRLTVDAFLGFSPSELSPRMSGQSLVVAMPALSSLGGVTSLPA